MKGEKHSNISVLDWPFLILEMIGNHLDSSVGWNVMRIAAAAVSRMAWEGELRSVSESAQEYPAKL